MGHSDVVRQLCGAFPDYLNYDRLDNDEVLQRIRRGRRSKHLRTPLEMACNDDISDGAASESIVRDLIDRGATVTRLVSFSIATTRLLCERVAPEQLARLATQALMHIAAAFQKPENKRRWRDFCEIAAVLRAAGANVVAAGAERFFA